MNICINLVDPIANALQWEWMEQINIFSILLRLCLVVLFGGLLGAERAMKRHTAGFRTYILVAIGAAIGAFTNQFIHELYPTSDVGRISAGIVTGIGFLGAGTIITTSRNKVKGLTTAAGLWACGCMGLAIGHGYYTLGIVAAILIFVILSLSSFIEKAFVYRTRAFTIYVELLTRPDLIRLMDYLREKNFEISNIEHNPAYAASGLSVYSIALLAPKVKRKEGQAKQELCKEINELDYVHYAEIMF